MPPIQVQHHRHPPNLGGTKVKAYWGGLDQTDVSVLDEAYKAIRTLPSCLKDVSSDGTVPASKYLFFLNPICIRPRCFPSLPFSFLSYSSRPVRLPPFFCLALKSTVNAPALAVHPVFASLPRPAPPKAASPFPTPARVRQTTSSAAPRPPAELETKATAASLQPAARTSRRQINVPDLTASNVACQLVVATQHHHFPVLAPDASKRPSMARRILFLPSQARSRALDASGNAMILAQVITVLDWQQIRWWQMVV